MDASASPRKPRVEMEFRSSCRTTLLVAWRRKAVGTSSGRMPQPLSVTRIKVMPPRRISTVMMEAPASTAFSTSSFMTEEGLSTTSPAAISSATCFSSTWIFGMFPPPFFRYFSMVQSSNRVFMHWMGVRAFTSRERSFCSTSPSTEAMVSWTGSSEKR